MGFRLLLRITAPTVALGAALLLFGGMAAWYLHGLQRDAEGALAGSFEKVRVAAEIERLGYYVRGEVSESLLAGGSGAPAALGQLQQQAAELLAVATQKAVDPREQALVAEIQRAYRRLFAALDQLQASGGGQRPTADRAQHALSGDVITRAAAYRCFNQQQAAHAAARLRAIADNMRSALLLLGLSGSVAGLLVGVGTVRGIQRAMGQLAQPIRDATGKLGEIAGPVTSFSNASFEQLEGALHGLSSQADTVVEQLHESHRAIARAEQMAAVGQLAAGLAHELRNPLMAMKILVQTATEQAPNGCLQGRDLAVMEEEITRLDLTLRAFLDYARPPRLEKQPVVVRDLVARTVELLSRQARESGVRIEWQLPERIVAVRADGGQLRQVLLNLLLNALEVSPHGSTILVRLHFEPASAEKPCGDADAEAVQWVNVDIADSGPGLPQDLGERIFEPFVSSKPSGTGLGLPICKRIAQAHGGQVFARNRPEGGAVFTLRLPVGGPVAPLEAPAEGAPAELVET